MRGGANTKKEKARSLAATAIATSNIKSIRVCVVLTAEQCKEEEEALKERASERATGEEATRRSQQYTEATVTFERR